MFRTVFLTIFRFDFMAASNRIVLASLVTMIPILGRAAELEPLCAEHTSRIWGVPVALLEAIHEVEGGNPGVTRRNRNGSIDLGAMQHNSRTANDLKNRYGVDPKSLLWSECYAVYVSGWTLATSAYKHKDWRMAVAAYNAGDGAVERALKRHRSIPIDIGELDLPDWTKHHYVPRVMSAWARYAARPSKEK